MLEVVDLFCGAGGMSYGLQSAGMTIRAGIDRNQWCVRTFATNFKFARGIQGDIREISASDILTFTTDRENLVLAGCPPCQLFSQLHRSRRPVGEEFRHYLRLLWTVRPAYLVFENVPRIQAYEGAWKALLTRLNRLGYSFSYRTVAAEAFGVPQFRRRLVMVAARTRVELSLPPNSAIRTVRDVIGHLPDVDQSIPNHVTMNLSPSNATRMKSTSRDGGLSRRADVSFNDSYGRMNWDRPSPTITTRCISFSNGRFGHPAFDRAITVREAASLQGFPTDFAFCGGIKETARQVGNAVPPPLATWLGEVIQRHHRRTAGSRVRSNVRTNGSALLAGLDA